MTAAITKIQDLRALVDLALMLQGTTPETAKALTRALAEAQETVARALAEASAALSTPPAPALESVATKDLKAGDRVLVAAVVCDDNDWRNGEPVTHGDETAWLNFSSEVLRDPREVQS